MEQMQSPATYDFRQYDQVWQRVSPTLDPYPGMCGSRMEQSGMVQDTMPQPTQPVQPVPFTPPMQSAGVSSAGMQSSAVQPGMMQSAAVQPSMVQSSAVQPSMLQSAQVQPSMMQSVPVQSGMLQSEENLPGAQMNPCCMGSGAADMLEVLEGFIEEELADRRYYLAFARQAPSWARQALRDTGEEEGEHARRLMAVYYLITGQCYRPAVSCERIAVGPFCAALRNRYHQEACGGFNYARAADGTTDICLAKLLKELSDEEYRHAERMMSLLERALPATSSNCR